MDEHQQHRAQFDQDGRPLQQHQPFQAPRVQVPWPDQQRPQQFSRQAPGQSPAQPSFPLTGQQQRPYQPQQQYHAAPQQGGFVQPGQPGPATPQFGVQDGVIGQAQPFGHHGAVGGQLQPSPPPAHSPVAGGMQQQYAFATPQGMQVMTSTGATALATPLQYQQQLHAAHQPMQRPPLQGAPVHVGVPAMPMRRSRMRWEVIVPLVAVFCLLVAVGVFAINFDEITGRTSAAASLTKQPSSQAADVAGGGAAAGDAALVEAEARQLMRAGRYDEAAAALAPLLKAPGVDAQLVRLGAVIDARGKRNGALLARLGAQRTDGRFLAALATLKQVEDMHPLSPSLVQLRAQLLKQQRGKLRGSVVDRAFTQATALLAAGQYAQALKVVDKALAAGPNRRLKQLRADIIAKRDAAARSTASGGGAGSPPASGGEDGAGDTGATAPPTADPQAPSGMPPVPDVPNTGGGGSDVNGGQPGTTGHEGMVM